METKLLWLKWEEGEWGPWRQEKVTRKAPHLSQQLDIALLLIRQGWALQYH